jgi:hypothetical protein
VAYLDGTLFAEARSVIDLALLVFEKIGAKFLVARKRGKINARSLQEA